jgi:hypothetical protein
MNQIEVSHISNTQTLYNRSKCIKNIIELWFCVDEDIVLSTNLSHFNEKEDVISLARNKN